MTDQRAHARETSVIMRIARTDLSGLRFKGWQEFDLR